MKLNRPASCVIFDLDGVLLDTEPLYTRAAEQILLPYGKAYDWSIKTAIMGRSSLEGARHLVRTLELPLTAEEYLERRLPILEALFDSAPEMPGAHAFVEALRARGVRTAVATSSERALYVRKTRSHAWFSGFQAVVCGDDPRIARMKPAPDIFLVTAAELGVAAEDCVVFEDSPAGVLSARAANMQVVAMPDPHLDRSHYAEATLVIKNYAEILPEDLGF